MIIFAVLLDQRFQPDLVFGNCRAAPDKIGQLLRAAISAGEFGGKQIRRCPDRLAHQIGFLGPAYGLEPADAGVGECLDGIELHA